MVVKLRGVGARWGGDAARASERRQRMRRSPAYAGRGRFRNAVETRLFFGGQGQGGVLARFLFERGERVPHEPLPLVPLDPASLLDPPLDGLRVTWLGHSSLLVELEGRRLLCDPLFADRSSPAPRLAGPRRFQPPPIALADLPDPHVVLISHDHYDHLDRGAVVALAARGVPFVVPLGVGSRLERWGVPPAQVSELDWWERIEPVPGELTIDAVPSRHFSGRGLRDRNRTLWAAFAIRGQQKSVFFGGDGGLYDVFDEIGERLGPFDLTALEIGASDPAWADIHLGPENAVTAHRKLRGSLLLPIHWGTFNLGLHAWHDPPERLVAAAARAGVALALPRIGESFTLEAVPASPWWRELLRR